MAALVLSATVSVIVVNMGGEYFHPIGRTSGRATSWSSGSLDSDTWGNNKPNLGTSDGAKSIR